MIDSRVILEWQNLWNIFVPTMNEDEVVINGEEVCIPSQKNYFKGFKCFVEREVGARLYELNTQNEQIKALTEQKVSLRTNTSRKARSEIERCEKNKNKNKLSEIEVVLSGGPIEARVAKDK